MMKSAAKGYASSAALRGVGILVLIQRFWFCHSKECGFYYLKSRYYDPAICRFINADDLVSTGQGFLGCNMFAYCNNNPVMDVDHNGQWSWDAVTDRLSTRVSAIISALSGLAVLSYTGSGFPAVATVTAVFGGLNNLTNQYYYNHFATPESSIETNTEGSSYTEGYVSRWDRLNYTKQQVQSEHYDFDAIAFYSEYSVHMYAWYALGWAEGKKIPLIPGLATSAKNAEVTPHESDPRWWVRLGTILWGLTGL